MSSRTKNTKKNAAKRANVTRAARKAFLSRYGCDTYDVVKLTLKGQTTEQILTTTMLWRTTVAAIRANLTRGTYDTYLKNCNF